MCKLNEIQMCNVISIMFKGDDLAYFVSEFKNKDTHETMIQFLNK